MGVALGILSSVGTAGAQEARPENEKEPNTSGGPPQAGSVPPPPPSTTLPVPRSSNGPEANTLRVLHDKGVLSDEEYESAVAELSGSTGARASEANTVVMGKWATTMYGFVESDNIWDSTRSFNDLAGNGQVARPKTNAGDYGRFTDSVRNSRIGFRLKAPEYNGIRVSGMLEMDFLGNQPPTATEGALFTNPTFRVRHFNLKAETPVVDILVGQYWQLFGWQSDFMPNTVEIQGVPGELYSRTPQLRISKTLKTQPVTFDVAVAAVRPVQRDSATPDGEAGMRLSINEWTGLQTVGATGTRIAPASVAVTSYLRRVMVDQLAAKPTYTNDKTAAGIAVDGYVPVIPASKDKKANSLSLSGEFATGYGGADFYTGLTGGVGFPTLPNPTNATPAPTYTPNIDPGIAAYSADGTIHLIQWTSYLVGLQYYLPGTDGKVWISGNVSRMKTSNALQFAAPDRARSLLTWFDVNLFVDPTPALRIGLEYANFNDRYADGIHAINHRGQIAGFFIF